MKTFLGLVFGFLGLIGMVLSYVGLSLWWACGIVAGVVMGTTLLNGLGYAVLGGVIALLLGLVGLGISAGITYVAANLLE